MIEHYKKNYSTNQTQFIFTDLQGHILESDQAFLKIDTAGSIFDVHPFFECLSDIVESSEAETTFNCVNISFDRADYTLDIKISKKVNGVLLVLHDLTEHYFSYQKIAQTRNESIINSELVVLKNIELEERERFKNMFIQNFSHELRNPLTSIIAITKIIGDTDLTTEQRKMLDFLKDANTNLKLMLEDVLSISMIATGRLKLEHKVFSLSQLLELLEFTYKTKAKEKGLEFKLRSDVKIPELVEGDRLRLFQVLTNLLDNAIKYTPFGKVTLQVLFNQKRANRISMRFQVTDTGVGIPQESLNSIFESFHRLDTTQNQNGTGLGLTIVSGLLELMQSKICVTSTLNEGSMFFFDLVMNYPLQLGSKPIPNYTGKKKAKIKFPKDGHRFKLLLVEDDFSVGMVLFKSLMNTKHFYIDSLNDGAMVMGALVNHDYDIILMDVNLPNVSGDQVTRLVRGFPFKNIKNIPIIGITANAYQEDINSYLADGMNAVLSKPFEEDTLLETIFKFLK